MQKSVTVQSYDNNFDYEKFIQKVYTDYRKE